jgi:glycosidase
MARPYRRFLSGAPWEQGVQAVAYLLTSPGVPCIYYGTEQGLDGSGTSDCDVRECMFGGEWGAFNTTGAHVFDEQHPIYKGIRAVTRIRSEQPALRYGRYYTREVSGNGRDFGYPLQAPCTLATSRVLDTDEVLIALNIGGSPRTDCITVDANLSAPGRRMRNLLQPSTEVEVRRAADGRAFVEVALPAYGLAILKCD